MTGVLLSRANLAAFLLVAAIATTSCALTVPCGAGKREFRLLIGYLAEDAMRRKTRQAVLGLDCEIPSISRGLTLGWSDLRLLSPAPDTAETAASAATNGTLEYCPPLGLLIVTTDGVRHRLGWICLISDGRQTPIRFIHHIQGGVSLTANEHSSGIGLGLSGLATLSVPKEENRVYILEYCSRHWSLSRLSSLTQGGPEHETK